MANIEGEKSTNLVLSSLWIGGGVRSPIYGLTSDSRLIRSKYSKLHINYSWYVHFENVL